MFKGKQIFSKPLNHLHLGIDATIKKIEYLHLIFQIMKNDRKINLPFTNLPLRGNGPFPNELALVYTERCDFVLMQEREGRDQHLGGLNPDVVNKGYLFVS